MWSRRQFLGALGASGATGALAPLIGCGPKQHRSAQVHAPALDAEDLAQALAILETNTIDASVWARQTTSLQLSLDHEEEHFDRFRGHWVALSGKRNGVLERIVLSDPTAERLIQAAAMFSEVLNPPAPKLPPLESFGRDLARTLEHDAYRDPLRTVFSAAQKHGSSRIVFRSAYLRSVLTEHRFMSRTRNLQSRSQRTRGGLIMAAWARREVATDTAEVSGMGGPELFVLSDDELASTAEQTLAHLHARSAPAGRQHVLLSPGCAAILAHYAIARCPVALPAPTNGAVRVIDDPTYGYGALSFDDQGQVLAPHTLVGASGAPLQQAGRLRLGERATLQSASTHIRVECQDSNLDTLVSKVETGVLLEGPELCVLDARGERFSLLASRGREIRNGRFTGRLYSRTLSTASLSEFISTTIALGDQAQTFAYDEDGLGSSAQAPHWLGIAEVYAA